jgi:hypothetical protein
MSSASLIFPKTSSQLAGLISDETGSGSAVFGTNPTLTGMTLAGSISANGHGINQAGNVLMNNPAVISTMEVDGARYYLAAYDVDGLTHEAFISFVAGNTPLCDLSDFVTKNGQYIYRAGGTDIPLADGGTGASLTDPNADRFMFWDDSAGVVTWLTPGANIINDTTLNVLSGTYTPTLTNVTNVASSSSAQCQYSRVGNTVTVSGMLQLDPTSASVSTVLGISLPIASNFTLFTHCSGAAAAKGSASLSGAIVADTANDRANLQFINTADIANNFWHFEFTYTIL